MGFSKQCTKCGKVKWWYEFYKSKKGLFSLMSHCKVCDEERSSRWREQNPEKARECAHRYQERNPEKIRDRNRRWREQNPEKVREYRRRWREQNPEKVREYRRRWREQNPEKERDRNRRWREQNPEKVKEKGRRWREQNEIEYYFLKKFRIPTSETRRMKDSTITDLLKLTSQTKEGI